MLNWAWSGIPSVPSDTLVLEERFVFFAVDPVRSSQIASSSILLTSPFTVFVEPQCGVHVTPLIDIGLPLSAEVSKIAMCDWCQFHANL